MVKSCRVLPALGVMLRASWLFFQFVTIIGLLCNVVNANSRIKISDVAGEEGTIDELEALLHRRADVREAEGLRLSGVAEGRVRAEYGDGAKSRDGAEGDDGAKRSDFSSGTFKPLAEAQAKKAEDIQFGVGPNDPRYFAGSSSDVRPNTFQTSDHPPLRSAPSLQDPLLYAGSQDLARADLRGLRSGYAGSYPNSGILNRNFADKRFADQRFADQRFADPRFADQRFADQRFTDPRFADPRQIDAYDQLLGDLSDQYDSAFADLVASRLAGYDQQADPRSQAFVSRLQNVLRSGDRNAAERMLGVHGGQNAFALNDVQQIKATSQPEFVHFNHQQQPHNRQVQFFPSDSTSKMTTASQNPRVSEDPKDDYNPNDPSSNVNSELKANNSEAALGGTQLAGLPQHLGQSQHSAPASQAVVQNAADEGGFSDVYFTAMVAGCTAAAVCFIIGTGVCWYRLNKKQRAAKDTEYPAYGVTGPSRELSPGGTGPGGDRNLAHSAHMYHYQQQKNQMIALDKSGGGEGPGGGGTASDVDSEEEDDGEERDYTVYECPGLAPMGEMVVPNPMYPTEDVTPASPPHKGELTGRSD